MTVDKRTTELEVRADGARAALESFARSAEQSAASLGKLATAQDVQQQATDRTLRKVDALDKQLERYSRTLDPLHGQMQKLERAFVAFDAGLDRGKLSADTYLQRMDQLGRSMHLSGDAVARLAGVYHDLNGAIHAGTATHAQRDATLRQVLATELEATAAAEKLAAENAKLAATYRQTVAAVDPALAAQQKYDQALASLRAGAAAAGVSMEQLAADEAKLVAALDPASIAMAKQAAEAKTLVSTYAPVIAATERLAQDEAKLTAAFRAGAIGSDAYDAALQGLAARKATLNSMMTRVHGTTWKFGGALQQVSWQAADVATQIAMGTNAMMAFAVQGGQLLGAMGPMGAAVGAVVTVVGVLAGSLLTAGDRAEETAKKTDVLAAAQQALDPLLVSGADSVGGLAKKYGELSTAMQAVERVSIAKALRETAAAMADVRAQADKAVDDALARMEGLRNPLGGWRMGGPGGSDATRALEQALGVIEKYKAGGSLPDLVAGLEAIPPTAEWAGGKIRDLALATVDGARSAEDLAKKEQLLRDSLALVNGTADEATMKRLNLALASDRAGKSAGKSADDIIAALRDEQAAIGETSRERAIATALRRLDAAATPAQREEVERLAAAIHDEAAARSALVASLNAQNDAFVEDAKRTQEVIDLQDAARRSVEDQIAALRDEQAQLGMSERERAIATALLKAEETARAGLTTVTDTQAEAIRRETGALYDRTKAAADANAAAEKAKREREDMAKREAEAMQRPFDRAAEGIQDAFTDTFEDIFAGGVNSFKDLGASVKRIFTRLAAEIATLMVFRPVVGSVMGSIGLGGMAQQMGMGGGGLGGLGGLGGIGNLFGAAPITGINTGIVSAINGFGASAFGMSAGGWSAAEVAALNASGLGGNFAATTGSLGTTTLSGALGMGAGGFGLGYLGGQLTGSRAGGAAIGGLGGAGLAALAGMGPIGMGIAAVAGIAGGLLGGKKPGYEGGETYVQTADGRFVPAGTFGKRFDAGATQQGAAQVAAALNAFLDQTGLKAAPTPSGWQVGFTGFGTGSSTMPQSVEAALDLAVRNRAFASDDPLVARALANTQATTIQEFTLDVQLASNLKVLAGTLDEVRDQARKTAEELKKQILADHERAKALDLEQEYRAAAEARVRLQLQGPQFTAAEAALAGINEQFDVLKSTVKELGLAITDTEIEARRGEAIKEFFDGLTQGIRNLKEEINKGELSGLSAARRLEITRADLDAAVAAGLQGDAEAINRAATLAQTTLALAQEVYASGAGYGEVFRSVNQRLDRLLNMRGFASGTSSAPPGLAWVGEHGRELVDFRGGERVWAHGSFPAGNDNGTVGELRALRRDRLRADDEMRTALEAVRDEQRQTRAATERQSEQLAELRNKLGRLRA